MGRRRRRISGATPTLVKTINPMRPATSQGSKCQSTTEAKTSGTRLATMLNTRLSVKSSNRVAKLSTRLVSEPAKLSWKNAASLASSASMPIT